MNIVVLVEGETEIAFKEAILKFLRERLAGRMPKLKFRKYDGHIPTGQELRRTVENLLQGEADAVIALTDVYTGGNQFTPGKHEFRDAKDAKNKMRQWVGTNDKFYPHVAQHDFEAWLLPFWSTIQQLAGRHDQKAPPGAPETVNHNNPPSYRIKAIFEVGNRRSYSKPRDAKRILKDNDLLIAANACPELKAFLNTILTLCNGDMIP